MLEKLKEKMMEQKKIMGELSIDLIPNKVSKEIQKQRIDICLSCDRLYKPTYTCKSCGCFMNVKTWMSNQSCPLKKWGKVESKE